MATGDRKRSSYFTPLELEILLQAYSEYEPIFREKSNKAVATKEREAAWEKIAARVNACNLGGEKRTWKQLKMKYKNMVQAANRKRAEALKSSGGPAPHPLTDAEELTLSLSTDRPDTGGSSSETDTPKEASVIIKYSDADLGPVEDNDTAELYMTDEEDDKAKVFAAVEREPEGLTESSAPQQEEAPSTSSQMNRLSVRDLYRMHLIKKMEKNDKEMSYLDRQIQKADLEIEILKHNLEEMKKTTK